MSWIVVIIIVIGGYIFIRLRHKKADLSMLPSHFIVFDLETTGLSPSKNEIIEIGAIKVNRNSNNHTTFQALIKPKGKIPKKIAKITGITQKMIDDDGEDIESVLKEFVDFVEDLRLVAFNVEFDMRFLKEASKIHDIKIGNQVSCALKMARRAWPGLQSYKLADLARMGGLSSKGNHRALRDCELALTVYTAAVAELGSIK